VTATADRERVRGDILRVAHRGLAVAELSKALSRVLERAVPFDGTCLLTIDPATLLPTHEVAENALPPAETVRLTEIELREPDFNKFAALARAPRPAASLSEVTAGDLDRSLRQRELRRPSGFDDELRVVLSDAAGTWGALTLLREVTSPRFTPAEVRFVASLGGVLADGVRSAVLLQEANADSEGEGDGEGEGEPADTGVLVLNPDHTVEMANGAADRWLDELGAPTRGGGRLPIVVHSVASRAQRNAAGSTTDVATARVRARGGQWVIVRGSILGDEPESRVVVLLEPARPPELAPIIADAYGLTERERHITELVARGFSTNEIAGRLHLAAYTVQDHLKSIFEKSGTGSRGELVARLFFDHYAPRLTTTKIES
jgi:DNA-binding CsgD family transcriptional regulator